MLDAISPIAKAMQPHGFMWHCVKPYIVAMFKRPNPPSLNRVLGLISPRVPQCNGPHDKNGVVMQAAATSAVLNPEEVHWSVVDEPLHLAFIDTLTYIYDDFPG